MVQKRRWAPVNVRTSCVSANERSTARLSVVQPRQSVWLPYWCRNWTATWSVWSYCCRRWAQLSVSWRTTAVIPWKWKQNRQTLWRSSAVLKLAVSRRFSNKNRQCVIVALTPSWSVHEGSLLPAVATQPPGQFALRSTATHGGASTLTYNRVQLTTLDRAPWRTDISPALDGGSLEHFKTSVRPPPLLAPSGAWWHSPTVVFALCGAQLRSFAVSEPPLSADKNRQCVIVTMCIIPGASFTDRNELNQHWD